MYIGVNVKYPLLLSDFGQYGKIIKYQISRKAFQ